MSSPAISCPNCGVELVPKATLTLKQTKVITALAGDKYPTQGQAAKAAGMSQEHLSLILKDPKIGLTLELAKNKHRDKARSSLAAIAQVKSKAWSKLLEATDRDDLTPIEIAGIAKIAQDAHQTELKIRDMLPAGDDDKQARLALALLLSHTAAISTRYNRRHAKLPTGERLVLAAERKRLM